MHNGLEDWKLVADVLFKQSNKKIDQNKLQSLEEIVLKHIAITEFLIKTGLVDLTITD